VVTQTEQTDGLLLTRSDGIFHPKTEFERDAVRKQLRKILESPVFQNSKRYASVLKFVVDQTLDGQGDRLKERTIGIEVFHRTPDYDTATDHAVRSAVAEVRKRLAQYYLPDTRDELRIEVLPGSYMPQFRWAPERSTPKRQAPLPVPQFLRLRLFPIQLPTVRGRFVVEAGGLPYGSSHPVWFWVHLLFC
jgi:hypothetical protein